MKRSQILLAALGAVLLIAVFYVLLYQPTRDEIAEIEDEIVAEQDQQAILQQEIARLAAVREQAPEVEAQLAAAEAIVPRDPALPAALRQLQLAADDSAILLQSVTTSRPATIEGAPPGLSAIDVNVQMRGGYFNLVDFLRRFEDPAISPRGLEWVNLNAAVDEYPDLTVSLTGRLFVLLDVPAPPPPPETETPADGDAEAETDDADDADVDVDVEVEDEDGEES